ncbi:hypothetical protein [Microcoleus sp. D3_18a_C4]|uniref:hypothetical protein n=1 Tax=Microcoleus sp. D3_18a_C4 TaxID=3055332 RepID=UPI002FCF2A30
MTFTKIGFHIAIVYASSAKLYLTMLAACSCYTLVKIFINKYSTGKTVYQIKHGLLSNYLIQQQKRPAFAKTLAQDGRAIAVTVA